MISAKALLHSNCMVCCRMRGWGWYCCTMGGANIRGRMLEYTVVEWRAQLMLMHWQGIESSLSIHSPYHQHAILTATPTVFSTFCSSSHAHTWSPDISREPEPFQQRNKMASRWTLDCSYTASLASSRLLTEISPLRQPTANILWWCSHVIHSTTLVLCTLAPSCSLPCIKIGGWNTRVCVSLQQVSVDTLFH